MNTLSDEYQSMAANGIIHAFTMMCNEISARMCDPDVLFRPKLSIDGNQWCALYGDNLQDGVAGFGDSPGAAMMDFNINWGKKLSASSLKSL